MDRIVELQQKRATLTEQARALLNKAKTENRTLNDEEKTQHSALMTQIRDIGEEIERERELAAIEAQLRNVPPPTAPPDPTDPLGGGQRGGQDPPEPGGMEAWLPENMRTQHRAAPDVHVGRNRAADRPWDGGFYPAHSPRYERMREELALGNFLYAVRSAVLSNGRSVDPRLLEQRAPSGATSNVPEDGGFFVEQELQSRILEKIWQTGQLLQRVDKLTITNPALNGIKINAIKETSRATGSRSGGVQGYWVGQGTAPTATKPAFRQITLTLEKLAALGYATDELLSDAGLFGQLMMRAFINELRFMTEDSIFNGTGAGQPLGVLNSGALVSVSAEDGQAATTVLYGNITNMWARFWAQSMISGAPAWYINQNVYPQLFKMSLTVGTGGVPVWLPANGLAGQPFSTLMGLPVIPVEYAASLGTVGDIMLLDLGQYMMIDKGAPQSATSMHVLFTTDEMAFRVIYRVDGEPVWESAVTPYKGTGDTISPFVALATRS